MKTLFIDVFLWLILFAQCSHDKTFYVDINGNDSIGNGSISKPWRSLHYAVSKIPANENYTLKISAGIFVEDSYINVPSGVNIEGESSDLTIIKAHPSLAFKDPEWHFDKFLIALTDSGGNQRIRNFTIDGDSKQLYGGIIVKDRSNVIIQGVRVQYCYFTGIWMWNTLDCRVTEVKLKDNAWGASTGVSASIMLSESERLEIDHLQVDEEFGQALEVVIGKMYDLSVHDNFFSVSPKANWQPENGQHVPNICVEMFNANLRNVQVYNNYFDNSLSLIMDHKLFKRTGTKTVNVYNNVFDLIKRAKRDGYGIELTINDVDIGNNYFFGGYTGVVNWETDAPARQGWKIHHNVFYDLSSPYPSGVINFYQNGINGAHIYNNTVEMTGTATVSFIEVNNGGVVRNMKVENNLIINSNTSYQHYPNKFINLIGASVQNVTVRNNFLEKILLDTLYNVKYLDNFNGQSQILKTGERPKPYYTPNVKSPLIDAGMVAGSSFSGSAPDIGAFEVEN